MRYLSGYVVSGVLPCLVSAGIAFGVLHVVRRERWLRAPGAPLVLPAAAGLALPIVTGGDHFSGFRFYQHVLPVLVLGLAFTTLRLLPSARQGHLAESRLRVVPALAVFGLALVTLRVADLRDQAQNSQLRIEFGIAQRERANGVRMERLFAGLPTAPSVGVIAAGGVKYEYDGVVIDLMGLNNLHIAHNGGRRIGLKNHAAFEKQSLYDLQPDIVAPVLVDASSWSYSPRIVHESFHNQVLRGIFDDDAFRALYRFCLITERASSSKPGLTAWVHQRRLQELREQPHLEIREFGYQPPAVR